VACEATRSSRRADLLSGNAGSATACPTSQDLPAQPGPPGGAADPGGIVDGAVPADGPSDPEIPLHEHFSRRSLAGGGEQIEAVVIARFLAGQRQTAVHLPIHPVLPCVPHVECEPLDDSAVELQVTAVHGYGVRVEVKRTADLAAEAAVPIGLLLTTDDRGICAA